ncbi:Stress-induced-phosphoprotein 1-like protein [Drosera capensis]
MAESGLESAKEVSLKDKGNEFFKAANYLKAAALYTQAIKQDPYNPTLYSNRAAAFLHLVKLNKALADADMTISLSPQWEKGYFRKGCILEALQRYEEALAAFQEALKYNSQNAEVSKKIKKLEQVIKEKKRSKELASIRSNVDMARHMSAVKSELVEKYGGEECCRDMFSFLVETMETAVKSWHETSKVDPRVYFLIDKEKTDTGKYAPAVNIDKAFESPHTHSSCFSFLREYAAESFSRAACLVAPKSSIAYPQVWKGEGAKKWKHGKNDGFFVQFESPTLRKLWFISSLTEMGQTFCKDPEILGITDNQLLPRLYK